MNETMAKTSAKTRRLSSEARSRTGANAFRSIRTYPQLWIGGFVTILLLISAVGASVIAPYGPSETISGSSLHAPSPDHFFGADRLGRDVFSRVLHGGRVSLLVSASAVLISMVVGVTIGLVSGFREGWTDTLSMRLIDSLMAFPNLVLALTIAFILGASAWSVIIALGVTRLPAFARLTRGQVLAYKHYEFVLAAEVNGASSTRILVRHLLPNLTSIILVQASLSAGAVIFAEASLGFLGMSVPPPTPTWGGMLHDGYVYLEQNPWLSIFPGLVISLAVLGFNFLGDGLRDRLDPHERRRRGA